MSACEVQLPLLTGSMSECNCCIMCIFQAVKRQLSGATSILLCLLSFAGTSTDAKGSVFSYPYTALNFTRLMTFDFVLAAKVLSSPAVS